MTSEREAAPGGAGRSESAAGLNDRPPEPAIPLLEWIVGGLGALLVGAAIAYLAYNSLTRDRTPPDLRLEAERVLDLGDGYLVQFRAFNEGGSAAAQVTIEGELVAPDGTAEVSEAVLDYVPPRSDREGGLLFESDPRAGELSLRARGYAKP
jgi:uncharacterized protein (TIGR02588 family)